MNIWGMVFGSFGVFEALLEVYTCRNFDKASPKDVAFLSEEADTMLYPQSSAAAPLPVIPSHARLSMDRLRLVPTQTSSATRRQDGLPKRGLQSLAARSDQIFYLESASLQAGSVSVKQSRQPWLHQYASRMHAALQEALLVGLELRQTVARVVLHMAKGLMLGVLLRLAQRRSLNFRLQSLYKQAKQQHEAKQSELAAAAAQRMAAQKGLERASLRRSRSEKSFTDMLLRQDDPQRGLSGKWHDLATHMRRKSNTEFRGCVEHLVSATTDASNALLVTLDSDASSDRSDLDSVVRANDCVAEEEALRSHIFISLLNAHDSP